MKIFLIYTFSLLMLTLAGCSKDKIPGVYRIDIQQGNDVSQEMLNQLEPGMTKSQVAYVMGTPLLIDTFHPNRWDYLYSFHPGNGDREQRRITVYFKDDQLDYIDGDTRVVARQDLPETIRIDSNVVVPLAEPNEGVIHDVKSAIGFAEDDVEDEAQKIEEKEIPVPTQGSGILQSIKSTLTPDSSSDEQAEEEYLEESEPEVDSEQPGLYQRLKSSVGLGETEQQDDSQELE